jgi:hypothetical protein
MYFICNGSYCKKFCTDRKIQIKLMSVTSIEIQCVPLATEPGWLADRCSVSQQLGALQTHTTDTFLFISHTTNVPLFKFRCNIFIGVRIIKEMPGSVASGTPCIIKPHKHLHKEFVMSTACIDTCITRLAQALPTLFYLLRVTVAGTHR